MFGGYNNRILNNCKIFVKDQPNKEASSNVDEE